jgi:membrane-associated phospholipid phosphatase
VYSNRHWFTDVVLGAVYGVTAAKLVNGEWRIFGLRPPTASVGPHGTVVGYHLEW